jgi:c-di-AMP phosphodiesterase-like protein
MEPQNTHSKLTFEQLPEAVSHLISEVSELKNLISQKNAAEQKKRRPIGIYEASKILKKEIGTIYNLTSTKKIPHHKRGHQLYFFEDELLTYIENGI